jgi:DNA mismatch repair ATPase MutS
MVSSTANSSSDGVDDNYATRKRAVAAAVSTVSAVKGSNLDQQLQTMKLDANALRDLDVVYTSNGGAKAGERGSLLWLVDHTATPMGRRLLHIWVTHPLVHAHSIKLRQDAVSWLVEHTTARPVVTLRNGFRALKRMDLDNGLQRIVQRRCTLAHVLKHLDLVATMCTALDEFAKGVEASTSKRDDTGRHF